MHLTVRVDEARAWVAYSRAIMAEIEALKRAGRLSPVLGSPADIEDDLQAVFAAVARLPDGMDEAPLDLSALRDVERWIYYGRAVWRWLDELRADGTLATAPGDGARRFQDQLLGELFEQASRPPWSWAAATTDRAAP